MKAIITQKSELRADLTIEVVYDIKDGDETVLSSQTLKAKPSEIVASLSDAVARFKSEYETAQEIEIPTEVE